MNPKRTSWKTGIASAMTSVARSRRMWTNSFLKTATNELRNAPPMRLAPLACGDGRDVPQLGGRFASRGGLLGQRDEHVLEGGLDLAYRRGDEARLSKLAQKHVVGNAHVDQRVNRLPEERGAANVPSRLHPQKGSRGLDVRLDL